MTGTRAGSADSQPGVTGELKYRPEIDGLRALAILSVVAFHLGLPGFRGGFVGVDVFFVISGYLITSILSAELRARGRVDLRAFYARRARRLMPALALVVVVSLLVGSYALHPMGEQQALGKSALAVAAFGANVFFWADTAGYFADPPESRPLLHTWSLAVEEQFYLLWPVLLAAIYRLARRLEKPFETCARAALAALVVSSLLYRHLVEGGASTAAFYLMPSRAWELGLGALVAFESRGRLRRPPGLAAIGLACVALAIARPSTLLIPTLGAAAILARPDDELAARPLAWGPLVYLGRVSYSWYLWHWPLLAIGRSLALGDRDPTRDAGLALGSLLLASGSYVWVENPARRRLAWPFRSDRHALLSGAALSVLIAGAGGALGLYGRSLLRRDGLYRVLFQAQNERPPLRAACNQSGAFQGLSETMPCAIGQAGGRIAIELWGDSHADQLSPLLQVYAQERRVLGIQRTRDSCPPILGYRPEGAGENALACAFFGRAVVGELHELRRRGLSGVVLSARWMSYESRPAGNAGPNDPLWSALGRTIERLRRLGLKVLVVAPSPEMRYDVPRCLARSASRQDRCDVARAEVEAQRRVALQRLAALAPGDPGVRVWDPIDALCDARNCPARTGDEILYADTHHLTPPAARRLYPWAKDAMDWLAAP